MTTPMTTPAAPETAAAVTIRAATAADYEVASALFRTTQGDSFSLSRDLWSVVCAAETHRALAAVDAAGEAVGIAVVVVSDRIRLAAGTRRRRFHIDELIVSPEKRKAGIGRALLEHIKAMAQAEAPSYVLINCDFMNVAARRLYEASGLHVYRENGDRFEIAFTPSDLPRQ